MKAEAIGDAIVKAINDTDLRSDRRQLRQRDMVGHSGKLEPTIKAIEAVDAQLGRIYKAIRERTAVGSSPPTTATPSRWSTWSPAARTPRTPPTRCP
jgi:2,3-bisphosphoglycerate-independent phosphoglycerate mutase